MFEMSMPVSNGEIMANVGMYWILSVALLWLLDLYACKKLGGKRMLGYKILRIPRFFSLMFVSGVSIVILVLSHYVGIEISYNALTFLGLPYFLTWIFFLVNVLRRVRAETKGRPGT